MGYNAASSGSPSGGGTKRQAKTFAKKNEPTPIKDFITGGGFVGAVIRGVTGAIKTANIKKKQNLMDYEGQAAGVTPMKSSITNIHREGGDNNSNAVVPLTAATTSAAASAPTTAEISQSSATDAIDTILSKDISLRKKKTKAIGRSVTILTSSKGVKPDDTLTLGKKSLLGA
tara:strand:+ start:40 stop:558 length:519 start_codon:yes stop_codon:yes gene_type:complete